MVKALVRSQIHSSCPRNSVSYTRIYLILWASKNSLNAFCKLNPAVLCNSGRYLSSTNACAYTGQYALVWYVYATQNRTTMALTHPQGFHTKRSLFRSPFFHAVSWKSSRFEQYVYTHKHACQNQVCCLSRSQESERKKVAFSLVLLAVPCRLNRSSRKYRAVLSSEIGL